MQAVRGRKPLAPRNRNTQRHAAKPRIKPRRLCLENDPPVRPPAPAHETVLLPTAAVRATAEQVAASIADALTLPPAVSHSAIVQAEPQPPGEACVVHSAAARVSASPLCPTLRLHLVCPLHTARDGAHRRTLTAALHTHRAVRCGFCGGCAAGAAPHSADTTAVRFDAGGLEEDLKAAVAALEAQRAAAAAATADADRLRCLLEAAEARAADWAGRAADTAAAHSTTAAAVTSLRGVRSVLLECCRGAGLTLPTQRPCAAAPPPTTHECHDLTTPPASPRRHAQHPLATVPPSPLMVEVGSPVAPSPPPSPLLLLRGDGQRASSSSDHHHHTQVRIPPTESTELENNLRGSCAVVR
jgi:hypothetical protein